MVERLIIHNGQYVRLTEEEYQREFPPVVIPPTPKRIYKADIWRRCTDEEAASLDSVLSRASKKLQRLYDGAQYISTGAPEYQMIEQAVVAALGAKRAAEILAPSET